MKRQLFWVGQRVRSISDPVCSPVAKGTLGTVTDPEAVRETEPNGRPYLGYGVKWDGYDGEFQWPAAHMEPVYDGDQKTSWADCAWQPNPVVKLTGAA